MEYELIIGLEVHVELSTKTKMYCSCPNVFAAPPNSCCCPVCTGMPGALPVLNQTAVDYAVRMGYALGCTVNPFSKADRKHYFYPDLPKGYQISQFDHPLCENGILNLITNELGETRPIRISRIHIEEDAGKTIRSNPDAVWIDFNRCGIPLIEIVTAPDLRSSADAKSFLEAICRILRCLDISDCRLQEGSVRCDVNVSLRPKGSRFLGERCEMKNISSFSAVQRAIDHEEKRQLALLMNGTAVERQTRRWDNEKGVSILMRSKEQLQDYRFLPEPDLPPVVLSLEHLQVLKSSVPELPDDRLLRFMHQCNLPFYDAMLLTETKERADFFEQTIACGSCNPKMISNWILGELSHLLNERGLQISQTKLTPQRLFALIALVEQETVSYSAAKIVLEELLFSEENPEQIIRAKNLVQINEDDALTRIVLQVLQNNPKAADDYKNGKTNALGFLVGQCMRLSNGQGNPEALRRLLRQALD